MHMDGYAAPTDYTDYNCYINVTDNIVVGYAVELYDGKHPTSILTRALTQRNHVTLMYAPSNLRMRNK